MADQPPRPEAGRPRSSTTRARSAVASTQHTHRPAREPERGAAVVEFALVAPVLLLLVLGIAEFGRAYYFQTAISGAAREGVRTMAIENDPGAARAAARAAAPTLDLSDGDISVSPGACPADGTSPAVSATVTVTYPMHFVTNLFANSLTLTGVAVMRCNG